MEVLETLTALEPLVAATMELVASVKFVASVKPAVKSVSTIPGQRWSRHRCHCQDCNC
jgi:hypothetical protein